MKKIVSMLCFVMLILTSGIAMAENEEQQDPPPDYSHGLYGAQIGSWGAFTNEGDIENGPKSTKVDGDGEGETETDLRIVGGTEQGGWLFCINDGSVKPTLAAGTHGPADNPKGYTGAVDATSVTFSYKSNRNVSVFFKWDYRIDKSHIAPYESTSKSVSLPSTNGELVTKTFNLSDFWRCGTKTEDGESVPDPTKNTDWLYTMEGRYSGNYAPAIIMQLTGINKGVEFQLHRVDFNWYNDKMVTKLAVRDYKTDYWVNRDSFDYNQGFVDVYRQNDAGEEVVTESIPFNDIRLWYNKKINTAKISQQTIEIKVYGKTVSYKVNVKEYLPENIESISVVNPQTEYLELENYNFKQGHILATYTDGTSEEVPLNHANVKVEGFDNQTPGENQPITVSYGGLTTTYNIKVNDFNTTGGLTIENPKRLYRVGESFNWHKGTLVPGEGPSANISSRYVESVEGFDSSAPVEGQEITVTYGNQTVSYTIDVIEDEIPVRYKKTSDLSGIGYWKWGDILTFDTLDNMAENGVDPACVIASKPGKSMAGAMFLQGTFGQGTVTVSNGPDTPATKLEGLKGADGLRLNYITTKTNGSPTFSLLMEYQNKEFSPTGGNLSSSKSASLPLTMNEDGTFYWNHNYIIPISDFDKNNGARENAESMDWLYNDLQTKHDVASNKFVPAMQLRPGGKYAENEYTAIDKLEAVWFETEPVASIEVTGAKTAYRPGNTFDSKTGALTINYKNGTKRVTDLSEVKVTGFDSNAGEKMQTVTLSYAGKTTSFDVTIGEPMIADPTMYKKNGETFEPIDTFTIGDTYKYGVTISGDLVKENTDIIICAIAYDQEGQILDRISEIPMTITPETEKQLVETAEFTAEENVAYKFFIIDKNSLTPYLDHAICNQVVTAK